MAREMTIEKPNRTLLLVDQERGILAALRRLLQDEGYQILLAENALAGFEALCRHDVGVVVSDELVSGMNGAQFLLEVRARFPAIPRIMLTGFASSQVVHDAIRTCGLFRVLSKPWDNEQLRETIRQAFVQHELSRERPVRRMAGHPPG